jgi:hypothetical protein
MPKTSGRNLPIDSVSVIEGGGETHGGSSSLIGTIVIIVENDRSLQKLIFPGWKQGVL